MEHLQEIKQKGLLLTHKKGSEKTQTAQISVDTLVERLQEIKKEGILSTIENQDLKEFAEVKIKQK